MYYKLFEVGVWKSVFRADLKDFCYRLKTVDKGRNKSNVNGWQSTDLDTSQVLLKPLIDHIEEEANTYALNYFSKPSFIINNMWVNINPTHSYNRTHTHPCSMFSGVNYIHTPKDCGNIYFQRPEMEIQDHTQSNFSQYNLNGFNQMNSLEWWMPSVKHTCYIFPSFLRHYVEPNKSKEDRLSISFNLV